MLEVQYTLATPAPVTCISPCANRLLVGSDDGTLRVYDLTTRRVAKAIRGLQTDISSIILDSQSDLLWLAVGPSVMLFSLTSSKMVMTSDDAIVSQRVGANDEDAINKLAINSSATHLAFCLDSGVVGTISIARNQDQEVVSMRSTHDNISSCVYFIPDRPNELVSFGYDHSILHFEFRQRTVLSRGKISPVAQGDGLSLSPPFIICADISCLGLAAAGTADGQVWVGFGGEKVPSHQAARKKSRKWQGLDQEHGMLQKVAEGPIVALCFVEARILVYSTLLGVVTLCRIISQRNEAPRMEVISQKQTTVVHKVNDLKVGGEQLYIGGLSKEIKGVIETWSLQYSSSLA